MIRVIVVVEFIGVEYELWKDWESLVDYFLVDYLINEEDMWLFCEDEEIFML